ncbi:MAG: rhodanese-like domain-containing protein [Sulfurovum sp.]|nr:rhodanese-like domain-containing protein [Sulfurovum sp.]
MFSKYLLLSLTVSSYAFCGILGLEERGVEVEIASAKNHCVIIKRQVPKVCKNVFINNETLWEENYAEKEVPDICKATFVKTQGHLLPMELFPDVETLGELEVLDFIKEMQKNKDFLLVDSRRERWFKYRTIPTAINVPFIHFDEKTREAKHFTEVLKEFGVTENKPGEYNFSKAKTLVLFCNGAWCNQSARMAFSLLEIDYPPEKIKWYRGGIQNWLSTGMTSTKDIVAH